MKEIARKHGVTFNPVHARLPGAYKRLQAHGGKHPIARAVRAGADLEPSKGLKIGRGGEI
jgi:hypothetical protein